MSLPSLSCSVLFACSRAARQRTDPQPTRTRSYIGGTVAGRAAADAAEELRDLVDGGRHPRGRPGRATLPASHPRGDKSSTLATRRSSPASPTRTAISTASASRSNREPASTRRRTTRSSHACSERAARAAAGEWILGRGWDQNDWPVKEFPTAAALDAAVPDHPVLAPPHRRPRRRWRTPRRCAPRASPRRRRIPPAARIVRDAHGKPTGVFVDAAMDLVETRHPAAVVRAARRRACSRPRKRIAATGLTEMHDAGVDDDTIRAVRELIDEKRFPIRVYAMLGDNDALLRRVVRAAAAGRATAAASPSARSSSTPTARSAAAARRCSRRTATIRATAD